MDMTFLELLTRQYIAPLTACNVGCSHFNNNTLQFIIQLNYIFVCIIYKVMYLQICNLYSRVHLLRSWRDWKLPERQWNQSEQSLTWPPALQVGGNQRPPHLCNGIRHSQQHVQTGQTAPEESEQMITGLYHWSKGRKNLPFLLLLLLGLFTATWLRVTHVVLMFYKWKYVVKCVATKKDL